MGTPAAQKGGRLERRAAASVLMFLLSAVLLLVGAAHGFRAVPSLGRLRGSSHALAMQLEASLPAQKTTFCQRAILMRASSSLRTVG